MIESRRNETPRTLPLHSLQEPISNPGRLRLCGYSAPAKKHPMGCNRGFDDRLFVYRGCNVIVVFFVGGPMDGKVEKVEVSSPVIRQIRYKPLALTNFLISDSVPAHFEEDSYWFAFRYVYLPTDCEMDVYLHESLCPLTNTLRSQIADFLRELTSATAHKTGTIPPESTGDLRYPSV